MALDSMFPASSRGRLDSLSNCALFLPLFFSPSVPLSFSFSLSLSLLLSLTHTVSVLHNASLNPPPEAQGRAQLQQAG